MNTLPSNTSIFISVSNQLDEKNVCFTISLLITEINILRCTVSKTSKFTQVCQLQLVIQLKTKIFYISFMQVLTTVVDISMYKIIKEPQFNCKYTTTGMMHLKPSATSLP